MFDVGFWELLLIGVVGLLVIGPKRLPAVARTLGVWVGRGKRLITSVKADIEQEIRAEELKRIVKEQQENNPLHEIIEDTKKDLDGIQSTASEAVDDVRAAADGKAESPK